MKMKKTLKQKRKMSRKLAQGVIKDSTNKIKKQGGSPSEISNKRKTAIKIYKDATKKFNKLSKQFGKK